MLARAWGEVLGVDSVGADESFFDLGGDSMKAIALVERVRQLLGFTLSPVSVFEHPTVERLSRFLDGAVDRRPVAAPREPAGVATAASGSDIAVIGMSIRVPGAGDVDHFWRNLCDGVESFTRLSLDELRQGGVEEALLADAGYVPMARLLDEAESFDAGLFGYSPREARFIDPQQRVLLECAWEALEHAGYDLQRGSKNVGTFVGSSLNTYLLHSGLIPQLEKEFVLALSSSDKDFLATRVNYKLDLRGPEHERADGLLVVAGRHARRLSEPARARECDSGAGRRSASDPAAPAGYLCKEGEILSPRRPLPAVRRARDGDRSSAAAPGCVVLKRLADARARRRPRSYAVIGARPSTTTDRTKVGYLAPSVAGQAGAIAEALAIAGVAPDTISYVEAHGTGTPIGDPIEVAASPRPSARTDRTGYCAARLAQVEHRAPGRGGGRGRASSRRCSRCATADPSQRGELRDSRTRRSISRRARSSSTPASSPWTRAGRRAARA